MWYQSTQFVSNLFLRLSVGVTMMIFGISFYRDHEAFQANFVDDLGAIAVLGTLWSYVLPGLLLVSGGLLAIGRYPFVAAWTGGFGLGSIPVGMALMVLMTNMPHPQALDFIYPILIWMVVFHLAVNQPERAWDEEDGEDAE